MRCLDRCFQRQHNGWQNTLEDVGPAGVDKGKGGKYLILPPDYKENVPDGHIPLQSDTYQGYAILRSNLKGGSDADIAAAVAYGKRVKLYPLAEAGREGGPQTRFVDAFGIMFDATIPYDLRYFESLDRFVQAEPWLTRRPRRSSKPLHAKPTPRSRCNMKRSSSPRSTKARTGLCPPRLRWSKACPPSSPSRTATPQMDAP